MALELKDHISKSMDRSVIKNCNFKTMKDIIKQNETKRVTNSILNKEHSGERCSSVLINSRNEMINNNNLSP